MTKLSTGKCSGSDQSSDISLAAVVIARNEEANIVECLQSLAWADRLCVLLDSRTNDRTAEFAREVGAQVAERAFVNFAEQRNAALQMFEADWIFFVDADERATPDLANEVRHAIQDEQIVGWWVPRRNYIWGRWIRHAGWYPDFQLRLLKRGRAHYDLAKEVHEIVQLSGPQGCLENPLTHYNYATIGEFLRRQAYYAQYEATQLLANGSPPKKQSLVLQPLREFWRRYITLAGYKDGLHGLVLSLLMGYYTFVAYRRARQIARAKGPGNAR